jgi:hypothetical protein
MRRPPPRPQPEQLQLQLNDRRNNAINAVLDEMREMIQ